MRRMSVLLAIAFAAPWATPRLAAAQRDDNPHGAIKESCATCHRAEGWKPVQVSASFKHAPQTFPLSGAHASTSCASCHKSLQFTQATASCTSCHDDVHHGELGADCARCHSSRSFVDRSAMLRQHQLTRFPLRGAHATVDCSGCHRTTAPGQMEFVSRPTTCASCHKPVARTASGFDHASAGFTSDCEACHTVASWSTAAFDHSKTQFPLSGAHRTVTCNGCHANGVYKGQSTDCMSCHQADYAKAVNPPHAAGFPTTCTSCHNTSGWHGASFDHSKTRFPLTGAHASATCLNCHANGVYAGTPLDCASCHRADYDKTASPAHAAAGFSTTCTTCHTTVTWNSAVFDHNATPFPLTGAHRTVNCVGCHADGVYNGKTMQCNGCHQAAYVATTNPPHAAAGFGTSCSNCHTTSQWPGAVFDHSATQFALTGAHLAVNCMGCHSDGVYKGKPTDCYSCHQSSYSATTNPPHASAGFPTTCTTCHTTTMWPGAVFDHNATQFPLSGSHLAVSCAGCHADGVYKGKPTDCYSCHQPAYVATTNPAHAAAGFGTTCSNCHNTTQWPGAVFDHNATQFPLTGAHVAVNCAGCHADGVYNGKPTDCFSCHQSNYNGTTNPPHAASGFPTTCATCHTTTMWPGAVFDHNATQFPLTGAHLAVNCAGCHNDGVYVGKPTDCLSCHKPDYDATRLPPHAASSIPTTCASCHTTTAWPGATYDHSVTQFPLTGAHVTTPCSGCHGTGVYSGTPTACYSCHQADYANSTNPNHIAAQFPTSCTTCHTTITWIGATFAHDQSYFPIYSGHHAGTWSSCATCHTNSSNYQVFTCLVCHEHSQATMDSAHQGRTGYKYESTACYACHPRGSS